MEWRKRLVYIRKKLRMRARRIKAVAIRPLGEWLKAKPRKMRAAWIYRSRVRRRWRRLYARRKTPRAALKVAVAMSLFVFLGAAFITSILDASSFNVLGALKWLGIATGGLFSLSLVVLMLRRLLRKPAPAAPAVRSPTATVRSVKPAGRPFLSGGIQALVFVGLLGLIAYGGWWGLMTVRTWLTPEFSPTCSQLTPDETRKCLISHAWSQPITVDRRTHDNEYQICIETPSGERYDWLAEGPNVFRIRSLTSERFEVRYRLAKGPTSASCPSRL